MEEQQKHNSTNQELSESHHFHDDFASKSELFMSMSSYVESSKTNDTISFLHQSQMDESNNQSLKFESLKKQDLRFKSLVHRDTRSEISVNLSKDEFMDSIEYI